MPNNKPPKKRRKKSKELDDELYQQDLTTMQSVIVILSLIFFHTLSLMGIKDSNLHRVRKDLKTDIFDPLGDKYVRRSYRMSKESFYNLHNLLEEELKNHFFPKNGGTRSVDDNPYFIKTEIRLSIAIRFFAGACPYDLMLTHGVCYTSVFTSVWGVVDVINKNPQLKIRFPNKQEQLKIAKGFEEMSGAGFDRVIGAIDGILIWIVKPCKTECEKAKCGSKSFFCGRKDKFGLNMQAICDNHLRFTWIDISWPGCTADYMAWITSDLYSKIMNENSIIYKGLTLVGDNAYVKSMCMSVPFKGNITRLQDNYNFYQSQLRITIERAFGVLVHRWAILRGPLVVPLSKVPPLVSALCSLHNFCINERLNSSNEEVAEYLGPMMERDADNVNEMVMASNSITISGVATLSNTMVQINASGSPDALLGGGEHFYECPINRRIVEDDEDMPMNIMYNMVDYRGLVRPKIKKI
jgi:hypothetical protein